MLLLYEWDMEQEIDGNDKTKPVHAQAERYDRRRSLSVGSLIFAIDSFVRHNSTGGVTSSSIVTGHPEGAYQRMCQRRIKRPCETFPLQRVVKSRRAHWFNYSTEVGRRKHLLNINIHSFERCPSISALMNQVFRCKM